MNTLFEQVKLDAEQFSFSHRNFSDQSFKGYYHYHQCCELLFVHQGEGQIIVNQQAYKLREGMLFYFQPFQLHRIHADVSSAKPYERSVLQLDPAVMEQIGTMFPSQQQYFDYLWKDQLTNQAFDMASNYSFVSELLDSLVRVKKCEASQERHERKMLIFMQLIACIRDFQREKQSPIEPAKSRSHRYSELIMQWVEKHYMEDFDLLHLAEELHLSKFYVSRIFRQETGSSITEYLTARRMKQACRLLDTTALSVEQIGVEVGLPNISYFCQLFKKTMGISPLQYRISE